MKRLLLWGSILGVGYVLYNHHKTVEKVHDVLVRTFAGDYLVDPPTSGEMREAWEEIIKVSDLSGMPPKWLIEVFDQGIPLEGLPAAASRMYDAVLDKVQGAEGAALASDEIREAAISAGVG